MKNIALYELNQLDELAWPETFQGINLESPATSVFTDLQKNETDSYSSRYAYF